MLDGEFRSGHRPPAHSNVGPTRTEDDFVAHIAQTVRTDPDGTWIFIVDQLNTHQSAGLVALVARRCALEEELGVKGHTGILQSMATRAAFSKIQPSHTVRLPPQTCVLVESGRDMVSICASLAEAGQFYLYRRFADAHSDVHFVLQRTWPNPSNGHTRAVR